MKKSDYVWKAGAKPILPDSILASLYVYGLGFDELDSALLFCIGFFLAESKKRR